MIPDKRTDLAARLRDSFWMLFGAALFTFFSHQGYVSWWTVIILAIILPGTDFLINGIKYRNGKSKP